MFAGTRATKVLVGMIILVALAVWAVPPSGADGLTRARTSDGGCVLVDWSTDPATATPTSGCTESDPCVYVDWTTTPPTVATGSYC